MSKSETTRKKVLDAAYELYVERGLFGVSMKDICKTSGVSNGSVFHHFKSKDQIIVAVYVLERDAYWDAAVTALEDFGGSPPEAIGEAVKATLYYQEKFPKRHSFMIECGAYSRLEGLLEPVRALNTKFTERFIKWALPHIQEGTLKVISPELSAAFLFAPSQWIGRAWISYQAEHKPSYYANDLAKITANIFQP
ncbi:MAG: TetR/AcrR family transcriptional regulator [Robiginitomaculum sp.]|nr:TetR/AcrR family transcriptional regulator [Robiginitomaculum sp.]